MSSEEALPELEGDTTELRILAGAMIAMSQRPDLTPQQLAVFLVCYAGEGQRTVEEVMEVSGLKRRRVLAILASLQNKSLVIFGKSAGFNEYLTTRTIPGMHFYRMIQATLDHVPPHLAEKVA